MHRIRAQPLKDVRTYEVELKGMLNGVISSSVGVISARVGSDNPVGVFPDTADVEFEV